MLFFIVIIQDNGKDDPEVLGLIRRVQQGDHEAFRRLMEIYAPRIQRIIYHRVKNENDIPDVQQDIFIRLYKALPSFRGEASLFSLLYRITICSCADSYNAAQKLPELYEDKHLTDDPEIDNDLSVAGESAEQAVLRNERQQYIRQLIGQLAPVYRDVFVLSEIEGYKDKEIAGMLGIREGTVKSRLSRARENFRTQVIANEERFCG